MKNIDEMNHTNGKIDHSTESNKSKVFIKSLKLSKPFKNIELAPAVQSGHLLNGIMISQESDALEAVTNSPNLKIRKIEIPSSNTLRDKFLAKWSEASKKNAKKGAKFSLLLLPLTACGGNKEDIENAPSTGTVIDGYISNALVFRDTNGNGIFDLAEPSTRTDESGRYSIGGDKTKQIIVDGTASGAIDIATGKAFTATLSAPIGSTVITPLTTLVQTLVDDGMTEAAAASAVKTGLGLDASTDLSTTDPIASSNTALYAAGVNVATLMQTAGGGANGAQATEALANVLKTASSEVNLSDADVVSNLLSSTSLTNIDTIALAVSGQAAALASASSVSDVANVQALTFVVSEDSNVVSFSGTATGGIAVTMNSDGSASFSRAGVDGANSSGDAITIDNIKDKEINFAGELSVVLTGASTSGDDSHVINAPDATKITLRGSMGDGKDEVRIKIADDNPGTKETNEHNCTQHTHSNKHTIVHAHTINLSKN